MKHRLHVRKALALALAGAFPFAAVAEDVTEFTSPDVSEVSIAARLKSNDQTQYGQYTGSVDNGLSATVGIDYTKRTDSGRWYQVQGSELGSPVQSLGVQVEQQGNWAVGLSYDQIPRYAPYTVFTNVTGIGTTEVHQAAAAAPLHEATLKTERDVSRVSLSKYFTDNVKVSFAFTNDDKSGVRMHSQRASSGIMYFVPEPIDLRHKQFEGTIDYAGTNLQLSGGYYGSVLSNAYRQLIDFQANGNPFAANAYNPTALAPDNSMDQYYLKAGYNFSRDTRFTFRHSHSVGKQNDSYGTQLIAPADLNAGAPSSLNAKVVTDDTYLGFSSRLTGKLRLSGSLRYQDRDNRTADEFVYATVGGVARTGNISSQKSKWGKVDADYNFSNGISLNAGASHTTKENNLWLDNEVAYGRKKVAETIARISVMKSMSDTLTGTLTYSQGNRDGSAINNAGDRIYPSYLAERDQEKWRALADWSVTPDFSLQFAAETFKDDYKRGEYGLESVKGDTFSLDASYALNDQWNLSAWASTQYGEGNQLSGGQACAAGSVNCGTRVDTDWTAKTKVWSDQIGLALKGKLMGWDVKGDLSYSEDRNSDKIVFLDILPSQAEPGSGVLPDTTYRITALRLQASKALSKQTKLRLEYLYDKRHIDDYQWATWIYNNGTYAEVKPNQSTQILGVTLIQSF